MKFLKFFVKTIVFKSFVFTLVAVWLMFFILLGTVFLINFLTGDVEATDSLALALLDHWVAVVVVITSFWLGITSMLWLGNYN